MIYRIPRDDEQTLYDRQVYHPLQSWDFGEFRQKNGTTIERLIGFEGSEPVSAMTVTFHKIPYLPLTIGYFAKGPWPDEIQLEALKDMGKRHQAICIKMEPDVSTPPKKPDEVAALRQFLLDHECIEGKPLFTKYSFVIDLKPGLEEIAASFKPKARYNIKVAEKHGVKIVEDNSEAALDWYLKLLSETTKRQQFYAHTEKYQRLMWQTLRTNGLATMLLAVYQDEVIAAWILFKHKQRLFYPYGASSRAHREVMASNLLMYEAIKRGKSWGCHSFDLWGALGPNPDPKDPWFGFHNFKAGYAKTLVEFVGSYDLVLNQPMYQLYRWAEKWRWRLLRWKSKLNN